MVRVEVHNFQSIQEGVVEIDGFSVVVGRSNIGKSALVRAVKAALTGAPVENYVRHGADCQRTVKGAKSCKCFCSVRIEGPGVDLLWEKGDSVNRYVYNGAEHTVPGKGTPEFLGPAFAPIQIGGDTTPTLLQVADQFRPLFILDRSGTAVADVLSDVAKLDEINEAARAVERDRRECQATRKVRDRDLRQIEETLALYDGLDVAIARVKAVEERCEAVVVLETKLNAAERLASALADVSDAISALTPVEKIEVRSPVGLTEQLAKLSALTRWCDSLQAKLGAITSLKRVAELSIPEVSEAVVRAQTVARLERWASQLAALRVLFAKFRTVETVKVPESSRLTALHSTYQSACEWAERVGRVESAIARLQETALTAEADEKAVLAEFKALEVCPTCRQPIHIPGHPHDEIGHA